MLAMCGLAVSLVAWTVVPTAEASAQARRPAPWCAYLGGQFGYECGYYTFEQCMETARGLGNFCMPNPWLQGGDRSIRRPGGRARKP